MPGTLEALFTTSRLIIGSPFTAQYKPTNPSGQRVFNSATLRLSTASSLAVYWPRALITTLVSDQNLLFEDHNFACPVCIDHIFVSRTQQLNP